MTEARWEEALLEAGALATVYPPAPDLVATVLSHLPAASLAAHGTRRTALRLSFALAALVLAVAGVLVASRQAREAVADFLGLAVEGERIELLPTPRAGITPTALPSPRPLAEVATPTTRDAVRARLGFEPIEPAGLTQTPTYYFAAYLGVPIVILHFERFDLWEVSGPIFEKSVFSKSTEVLEQLEVNRRPAYWLAEPHIVRFLGQDGTLAIGSERAVPGKTLLWRGASLNYRLETETLTREEALAIAITLP